MRLPKQCATSAVIGALLLTLSGCGDFDEANHHNQPIQSGTPDLRLAWQRVDSPPNYPTIVWACHDKDGIYIDQDSANSVEVVPNDPECAR